MTWMTALLWTLAAPLAPGMGTGPVPGFLGVARAPWAARAARVVVRHDESLQAAAELARSFDATARLGGLGSGTLIDRHWVVTAAHVAHALSPFAPTLEVDGVVHPVRQVVFHPKSESNGMRPPEVDLALVRLDGEGSAVEPAPLFRGRDELGRDVVLVGYGDKGLGDRGFAPADGVRRAATNVVERVSPVRLVLDFDAPPEGTVLEGVGAPGDSGGPLFLEGPDGPMLVGVSSASMGGQPGTYGVQDVYVRVSSFADWIDAVLADPPAVERPELVDVTEGFPESPQGSLATLLFESYASADADVLRAFGETMRTAGNARRNPLEAFVDRVLGIHRELGALRPTKLAPIAPDLWLVLVESERAGWHAFHLRLAEGPAGMLLDDLDVQPEPGPEDSK